MFNRIKKAQTIGIVSDGIISNIDINDGAFLPAVVVHHKASSEFTELVKVHQDLLSGDLVATWGWHPIKKSQVFLQLEFKKPSSAKITLRLDAAEEFSIIEGVLFSKVLYIILGEHGDKPSAVYGDKPALLIEVAPELMNGKWNSVATKAITKKFLKSMGSKKEAKLAAIEHIKSVREFLEFNRKAWHQKLKQDSLEKET